MPSQTLLFQYAKSRAQAVKREAAERGDAPSDAAAAPAAKRSRRAASAQPVTPAAASGGGIIAAKAEAASAASGSGGSFAAKVEVSVRKKARGAPPAQASTAKAPSQPKPPPATAPSQQRPSVPKAPSQPRPPAAKAPSQQRPSVPKAPSQHKAPAAKAPSQPKIRAAKAPSQQLPSVPKAPSQPNPPVAKAPSQPAVAKGNGKGKKGKANAGEAAPPPAPPAKGKGKGKKGKANAGQAVDPAAEQPPPAVPAPPAGRKAAAAAPATPPPAPRRKAAAAAPPPAAAAASPSPLAEPMAESAPAAAKSPPPTQSAPRTSRGRPGAPPITGEKAAIARPDPDAETIPAACFVDALVEEEAAGDTLVETVGGEFHGEWPEGGRVEGERHASDGAPAGEVPEGAAAEEAPAEEAPEEVPEGAAAEEAPAAGADQSALPPCGGKPYAVPDDVKALILDALSPSDVDVGIRNKMYSAISRMVNRPTVDPTVSGKWAEAHSHADKFAFLKVWVEDPSMAKWVASESHARSQGTQKTEKMVWKTKFQVYADHHAHQSEPAMIYCDALLSKAKTRPSSNPKHKKDKNFTEYYVPGEHSTAKTDAVSHESRLDISGELSAASNPKVVEDLARGMGKGLEGTSPPPPTRPSARRKAQPKQGARKTPKPDASFCALAVNKCMADVAEAGIVSTALASSK
ncbi:unnamed protein product, partial [Prorocentrum cordatum]